MLKSVISYFWPQNDDNLTLEGVYSVLNKAASEEDCESEDSEITEKDDNYACFHKTGVVTQIDGDKYIIDSSYECKENKSSLKVGTKVSFIVHTSNRKLCVTNVEVVDSDWNCTEGSEKFNWFNRTLISKVIKRDGRKIFVSPGDVIIDLNSVSTEFIPLIGDWVELDLKCEADETMTDLFGQILEVKKVSPVRPKIAEGNVKAWNSQEQTGVINQNIFFNREGLCEGYIPAIGDKVVAEIIESEQGRCSWRALKILPGDFKKEYEALNFMLEQIEREEVRVSEDIFINDAKIGDNRHFEFTLLNTSSSSLSLVGVVFQYSNLQCRVPENFPVVILSNESISVEGIYNVNTAGQSKESLTFVFEDFKVVRWINVVIKTELKKNYGQYCSKNAYSNNRTYKCNSMKDKEIIPGQKPQMPPRFIPYSLPEYPVPQKLWDVFLKYGDNFKNTQLLLEDLMIVKPVLSKPLAYQCYEDRFHTLLHLEEISNIQAARIYDREKVCFIRNGEYLMLEIENLSEQRPSIICGNSFIASDPYQPDSPSFEGFVHKVGAKHVHLKFSPIFHSAYNGEDYSIRVVLSRSQIRKMHQALGLVIKNLGRDFLFPSKVVCKEYQVNFTCDKYDDSIQDDVSKTPSKMSNSEILNFLRVRVSAEKLKNDSANVKTKLSLENVQVNNSNECSHPKSVKQFKLEWFDKSLNFYQKEAVRNIMLGEARPLPYFIFGPPGTGKTITLVETILQLLRMIPHSRLLVGTPSNSSADLITMLLIESGVLKPGDLVRYVAHRYVAEGNIPEKLAPYCATGNIARDGTSSQSTVVTESGLVLGCSSVVLGRQRITVGTCVALGYLFLMGFPKGHFTHVIIDEAAQATEPEVMIPLSFLDVASGQVILAGDPMQLGPIITSKCAAELGLSETFMERMLQRFPYVRDIQGFPNTGGYDPRLVTKLMYNYRSLPEILELSNFMFYHSDLLPTISADDSAEAKLLQVVKEILPKRKNGSVMSFVVHGVNGSDYQTLDSPSWFNPDEVSQVFFYLNQFYRLGLTFKDIGIISPYIKQVKEIRSLLVEAEFDLPKIGTVEEFQGQEFNVVLLSTVRSYLGMVENDKKYNLGFIANPRRLNVALTRAKSLIIIIGNPHLLVIDSFWRNVLKYAIDNGTYCGCDLPSTLCK